MKVRVRSDGNHLFMGKYTATERRRRNRIREQLLAARDRPCADCGIQLPAACMDLDHVRGPKLFALNVTSAKGYARPVLEAEIAKCDVRCPNCHRLRHYLLDDFTDRAAAGGGSPRSEVADDTSPMRLSRAPIVGAERDEMVRTILAMREQRIHHKLIAERLNISVSTLYKLAPGRGRN